MSAQFEVVTGQAARSPMSGFERYLTVWVALCIVAGIALGQFFPGVFQAIGQMAVARVNIPVGLLIWVMIIPMLVKIDFGALHQVKGHWRGIGITLFVNWAVKLSRWRSWAGSPIVGLLLGIASITVPWDTLLTSVVLYIVIPVILAQWLRNALLKKGEATFQAAMARIGPWSIAALLATLVVLFAFPCRSSSRCSSTQGLPSSWPSLPRSACSDSIPVQPWRRS